MFNKTNLLALFSMVCLIAAAPCKRQPVSSSTQATQATEAATTTLADVVAVETGGTTADVSVDASTASSGTATYYAAGLGACGWTNSGSDYIVAVNQAQYNQADCGKTITVSNAATGRTTTAQIADLCPTCAQGDLDLSEGLFSYLNDGNLDAGVFDISWSMGGASSTGSASASSASATQTQSGTAEAQSTDGSEGSQDQDQGNGWGQ